MSFSIVLSFFILTDDFRTEMQFTQCALKLSKFLVQKEYSQI